jgi:hypothetical protein
MSYTLYKIPKNRDHSDILKHKQMAAKYKLNLGRQISNRRSSHFPPSKALSPIARHPPRVVVSVAAWPLQTPTTNQNPAGPRDPRSHGGAASPRRAPPPPPPGLRRLCIWGGRGAPEPPAAGAAGRPGGAVLALGLLRLPPGARARSRLPPRRRPQALAPPLRPVPLRRPRAPRTLDDA